MLANVTIGIGEFKQKRCPNNQNSRRNGYKVHPDQQAKTIKSGHLFSWYRRGVQKLKDFFLILLLFCFSWIGTKQLLHHMPVGPARSKRAWPLPIQWIPDQEQARATRGWGACMHQTMRRPKKSVEERPENSFLRGSETLKQFQGTH
jgi:hypothetical protein